MAFQNNHSKEKSMNLNTGYFAAYNQRHKRATIAYRLSLNNQQQQHLAYVKSARSSSVENKEPFLPSITTTNGNQNGHRPYRRNDFANNHLFVAKQKLAKFFLDEPIVNNQSKDDLIHLFDQQEPKQKHRRNTKSKQVRSISI
jgi:heat shock protein HspQ